MNETGFQLIGFIGDLDSGNGDGTGSVTSLAGTTVHIGTPGSLVFDITWDSSVANAPAGFTDAITDAVLYYENVLTDPVTVNIAVGWGEIDGQALAANALGESETNVGVLSYPSLVSALQADAKTPTDAAAVASLPASTPVGSNNLVISAAEAKALGFSVGSGIDGYIGFSSGVSYTFDPNNRAVGGEYDLIGVAEHEITEVMGRAALLGETIGSYSNTYSALDLFRYGSPGVRQLTPGQPAYFSVDGGATDLDNFNTNLNGDFGDWANSAGNDSYLAFGSSGVKEPVSASDLKVMDALGWDAAVMTSGTVSPDGSTLTSGQSGDLVTSAGTWTFATTTNTYGNLILLNGQQAAAGSAVELEVDNGGNMYADNAQGQWFEWNGAGWNSTNDPNGSTSPDGSTLTSGQSGDLVTSAGTWTFATTTNTYGNLILLNGQQAAAGSAVELEVDNGGNMYADNAQGQWFEWNGAGWNSTNDPNGSTSPDGSTLTSGQSGDLVTSAGTWTFATTTNTYGNLILLNGQQAAAGSAVELEVDNGGNMYADNAQGQWFEWNGAGWNSTNDPNGSTSPDGSTLTSGQSGDLVTSAGTWTFATTTNTYGNLILLNGQQAAAGSAVELEVDNGGNMYADNAQGQWFEWNGAGWNSTSNPNPATPPPTTTAAFLNVAENAAATPIGIAAPTDPNDYTASQLSVTVTAVPSDGTALLNGAAVTVGETLSVPQLTALDFAPTAGAYSQTSPLAYTVTDPSGASAEGTASLTIGPATGGGVLTVGAGQEYATLDAAVTASQNGDTIEVQAGTYVNDFSQINTNITIEGVGGMAVFEATESIPNGKAILVTDGNVTIDNLEFTGATVADNNGAGIRYESGDLILNDDYFYNNQEGLLAAANPSGNLLITNTEFNQNGDGSGSTHNIYIGGDINSLTIDDSYIHDAVVGHEVKSRAANTYIYNSRIFDLSGTASYSVDLPNGGNVILADNVIQQGPNSQNPDIIAYGEEGSLYAGGSLQMYGNTLVNDLTSQTPLGVWNDTGATAQLANTQIYGLTPSEVAAGPVSQTGTTFLSSQPTLDTSHPWLAMT